MSITLRKLNDDTMKTFCVFLAILQLSMGYYVNPNFERTLTEPPNSIDRILKNFFARLGQNNLHERRGSTDLSRSEREEILDLHNELRRNEGGSNMEQLKWNNELADKAQELAETCVFDHDMQEWPGSSYPSVGQNLYLGGALNNRDVSAATMLWFNEKDDYDYSKLKCDKGKVCGHYTQLVWGKSREMGCGAFFCESAYSQMFGKTYTDKWYIACNYGPKGNFRGKAPFLKGEACSECQGGDSWCKDDLCVTGGGSGAKCKANCEHGSKDRSSCSCECEDGWYGVSCSEECKDYADECGPMNGWPGTWCDDPEAPFVAEGCPLMCGKCVPEGGGGCRDMDDNCNANPGWYDDSWCRLDYVAYACPKMCGQC